MKPTFTTSIRELTQEKYLTHRSFNTCVANGIENVRDLDLAYDNETEFLHFRNCGQKTNKQLTDVRQLAYTGYPAEIARDYANSLPEGVKEIFVQTLREIFPEESASAVPMLFHRYFTPDQFIFQLYIKQGKILDFVSETEVANKMPSEDGVIEHYGLRRAILKTVETVIERMKGNYDTGMSRERNLLKNIYHSLEEELRSNYVDSYYEALLSPEKMILARREYDRLVEASPKIVKNFMRKKGLDMNYIWGFLGLTSEEFLRQCDSCRKGAQGYYEIINKFLAYLERLSVSSEEDDQMTSLRHIFNFLTDAEAEQCVRFKNKHGHLPMFFITNRYFSTTALRQHQIYARCYGLGGRSARRKTEVADELGISRERVRQIITESDFSAYSFANPTYWQDYPYQSRQLLSARSKRWDHDMAIEGVTPEFSAFAGMMVAVFGFSFKRLAGVDKFVVDPKQIGKYGFYLQKMLDMRDRIHVDNILIHISDFLEEEDRQNICIKETVRDEIARYLEVQVIGENLFFPHNSIDVASEVESILRKEGNPLHIDQILERMQESFPTLRLTRDRLKFQMRSSDEIVPKGKTSLYCLRSWSHIFIGSIRDLVKQILADKEVPLSIDEIMETVAQNFDTTRYNVYNSLFISDDFTLFEGKRFGLSSKEYPSSYQRYKRSSPNRTFKERFDAYRQFVETNGHHPFNSGIEEEEILKRWQTNVLKQLIRVTPEELTQVKDYLASTEKLPFTHAEYKFKRLCDSYLDAIQKLGDGNLRETEQDLVKWYKKTSANYGQLTGKKRIYFDEMLSHLSDPEPNLFSE